MRLGAIAEIVRSVFVHTWAKGRVLGTGGEVVVLTDNVGRDGHGLGRPLRNGGKLAVVRLRGADGGGGSRGRRCGREVGRSGPHVAFVKVAAGRGAGVVHVAGSLGIERRGLVGHGRGEHVLRGGEGGEGVGICRQGHVHGRTGEEGLGRIGIPRVVVVVIGGGQMPGEGLFYRKHLGRVLCVCGCGCGRSG